MTQTLLRAAADFEQALAAQVSAGATTATLDSIADSAGTNLTAGTYGFTIDGDNQYKEFIVADLSGTSLTNIVSITPQGASSAGFSTYHRKGASVVITDWAVLSRILNLLFGTTGFDSATPLSYDAAPTFANALQIVTKGYVDSVVAGGTVSFDQQVLPVQTAGENLTAGNAVYFKTSDQRWYKTDADASATSTGVQLGIALSTQTTGNTLSIAISGPYTTSGLTAGSKYYLSQTSGAITTTAPSAPAFPVLIGIALSTTKLWLIPYPTSDQFAGVTAQPSSTNKFLDQASASDGTTDQSQTTQNGTFSAGEANATTRHNKLAQSFIPAKTLIKSVNLYKSADTGTFTGTVSIAIQADSAGSPSGVDLVTKTITNALWAAYATGDFLALFSTELTVTPGNLYWIVITTSTSDTANCINLGTNTAGGYASGSAKYNNTADGWVAISTIDLYFKVNQGFAGKEILGNTTGFIPTQVKKATFKIGNITLANSATSNKVAHGLGTIPSYIEAWYGTGSNSAGVYSAGVYDVANAVYASNGFSYNEASSGGALNTTSAIITSLSTTGGSSAAITVQVDENVVIFSADANLNPISYKIVA